MNGFLVDVARRGHGLVPGSDAPPPIGDAEPAVLSAAPRPEPSTVVETLDGDAPEPGVIDDAVPVDGAPATDSGAAPAASRRQPTREPAPAGAVASPSAPPTVAPAPVTAARTELAAPAPAVPSASAPATSPAGPVPVPIARPSPMAAPPEAWVAVQRHGDGSSGAEAVARPADAAEHLDVPPSAGIVPPTPTDEIPAVSRTLGPLLPAHVPAEVVIPPSPAPRVAPPGAPPPPPAPVVPWLLERPMPIVVAEPHADLPPPDTSRPIAGDASVSATPPVLATEPTPEPAADAGRAVASPAPPAPRPVDSGGPPDGTTTVPAEHAPRGPEPLAPRPEPAAGTPTPPSPALARPTPADPAPAALLAVAEPRPPSLDRPPAFTVEPSAPPPRPVQVRIGAVELRAETPGLVQPPAPLSGAGRRSTVRGFDEYRALRSHAGWAL